MGNDHTYSIFPSVHLNASRQLGALGNLALQSEAGRDVPKGWHSATHCMADLVFFKSSKSYTLNLLGFAFGCFLWLETRPGEGVQAS